MADIPQLDNETERLLDDLLTRTLQMERSLNEIEEEVGGFRRRSRNDDDGQEDAC